MENTALPEKINAIRVITYDVPTMVHNLRVDYGQDYTPTLEEIVTYVQEYASEDLSCDYGHVYDMKDVIFQDENGVEL
jgi:hypothetical protein